MPGIDDDEERTPIARRPPAAWARAEIYFHSLTTAHDRVGNQIGLKAFKLNRIKYGRRIIVINARGGPFSFGDGRSEMNRLKEVDWFLRWLETVPVTVLDCYLTWDIDLIITMIRSDAASISSIYRTSETINNDDPPDKGRHTLSLWDSNFRQSPVKNQLALCHFVAVVSFDPVNWFRVGVKRSSCPQQCARETWEMRKLIQTSNLMFQRKKERKKERKTKKKKKKKKKKSIYGSIFDWITIFFLRQLVLGVWLSSPLGISFTVSVFVPLFPSSSFLDIWRASRSASSFEAWSKPCTHLNFKYIHPYIYRKRMK